MWRATSRFVTGFDAACTSPDGIANTRNTATVVATARPSSAAALMPEMAVTTSRLSTRSTSRPLGSEASVATTKLSVTNRPSCDRDSDRSGTR